MHVFKDNAGRTWTISINVSAIKAVKGLTGVNLYSLVDDGFQGLGKLLADPCDLIDVIFCLCRDEAEKQGVSDIEFGRAFAGDVIDHASKAFVEELTDFFPDPRIRAGLRKVAAKGEKVRDLVMAKLDEELEKINPEAVLEGVLTELKRSSGNSPESSESTQGHSRSANLPR